MGPQKILSFLIFALSLSAQAQVLIKADPANDVHHNINNGCYVRDTDIISTRFERNVRTMEDSVEMELAAPINTRLGYKEFYFWIDADPGTKKGYQPYNPDSVAWKNFYADYRIFASFNNDMRSGASSAFVGLQSCATSDCSKDGGLISNSSISVRVQGNKIHFKWPSHLVGESLTASKIKIGYTTYYELVQCNGEDDAPQWGQPAYDIELNNPTSVPAL
jgi:hypothetical protein